MKTVGITGGTGFIGTYFLEEYAEQYRFVVATSKERPSEGNIIYKKVDYTEEAYEEAFVGCDVIVHMGAGVPNQVTSAGTIGDYYGNISSTEAVYQAAAKLGIRNMIDLSSVSVYEKLPCVPLKENQSLKPENCYGIAKVTAELLGGLYEKHFGIRTISLRVAQVLGYREYNSKGFFQMLLDNSIQQKPLVIYGSGQAARDYIYVKDVCCAIDCAIRHPEVSGAYNVGSGKAVTNLELAQAYQDVFQNPNPMQHVSVTKDDQRFWYMDVSKAKQDLDFTAKYGLYDMVKDIKREYLSR